VDESLENKDKALAVRTFASRGHALAQASRPTPKEELQFVCDPLLRQQLASDWREAETVFAAKAWKATTVLCGAVMEGILYDAIRGLEPNASSKSSLSDLLHKAEELGILKRAMVHIGQAVREYRNLIHPERQLALGATVSEHEAQIAMSSVRILLVARSREPG